MKFTKKPKSIGSNNSSQRGVTLLEVVVSLAIMMVVGVGLVQLSDRYSEDVTTSLVADNLKRTGDASRQYIKDNYATIAATATSSSPFQITSAMLVAGNYLPTGTVASNGYHQNVCTLVLQPSANKLQAMVVTEGGSTINDLTLGNIVQLAGASAGAVLSSASTTITGAMGGWSIPVSSWHNLVNNLGKKCDGATAGNVQVTTGHAALVLWFEDGVYQTNALQRDLVPGQPQLNTVNTPIIFNATQTVGAACTTSGALANNASGVVINCTGGTWKQISSAYWADPVANFASLPTCNAAAAWATRVVQTPSASGGSGPRAYTCNGSAWKAIAVDDTGSLVIGNTAVGAAASTSATGSLAVGTIEVKKQVTLGTGCSPNGSVAVDSNGSLLSCRSGVWSTLPPATYPLGHPTFMGAGGCVRAIKCETAGMSSGGSCNHYVYPNGDYGDGTFLWCQYTACGSQVMTCWN